MINVCKKCGTKFNSKFCPECGASVSKSSNINNSGYSTASSNRNNEKPKKKGGCLKTVCIVFGVIIVIGVIGSLFGDSDDAKSDLSTVKQGSNKSKEEAKPKAAPAPHETELSAGNYTAGIDFPSGTYTLTAVSGTGNVSTSNMYSGGLNEIMSNPKDEYSIDVFNNAKLDKGISLTIGGSVIVHLSSAKAAVSEVVARVSQPESAIDLGSGNYVAGTDFPEGTYTIVGTGESGNVSSDNMYNGGLNEILGSGTDGFSIHEFKNATFEAGNTLTIGGTSVQLIPSVTQ